MELRRQDSSLWPDSTHCYSSVTNQQFDWIHIKCIWIRIPAFLHSYISKFEKNVTIILLNNLFFDFCQIKIKLINTNNGTLRKFWNKKVILCMSDQSFSPIFNCVDTRYYSEHRSVIGIYGSGSTNLLNRVPYGSNLYPDPKRDITSFIETPQKNSGLYILFIRRVYSPRPLWKSFFFS